MSDGLMFLVKPALKLKLNTFPNRRLLLEHQEKSITRFSLKEIRPQSAIHRFLRDTTGSFR